MQLTEHGVKFFKMQFLVAKLLFSPPAFLKEVWECADSVSTAEEQIEDLGEDEAGVAAECDPAEGV